MNDSNFHRKIINATKWSTITQILAKLVNPITNMILARLLTPEAFGVVATITMITSFAEMLSDAGFQKYLVQHEFKNKLLKHRSANVAFITNFTLSSISWVVIIIFSEQIANLVGNPGLGIVIAIACVQLPLTAFSSIQMALFKRDFDFKTLFLVRMVSILLPFFITIPLALMNFGYWALIIGTIIMHLFNAIILTLKSEWKPSLFFDIRLLTNMLSFSIWSLIEAVAIWLTAWIDVFIISTFLSEYELGLYKTSTIMVNALIGLVTASVIPVLFSALSRLQNDTSKFKTIFYRYQKAVAYLVVPMGFGLFVFSDLATDIMLGKQWSEASKIIGIWAFTTSFVVITSHFNSEVYRARGKPKLSFLSQLIHLSFLIPTCFISVQYGFWALVYARALIRFQGVITGLVIMKITMNFHVIETIKNVIKPLIFSIAMTICAIFLKNLSESVLWSFTVIIISIVVYFLLIIIFAKEDVKLVMNEFKR